MEKNKSSLKFWISLLLVMGSPSANAMRTQNLVIGEKTLQVEVAEAPSDRERGLMFRKELREGHGMLFVFESEQPLRFWMKNTFIPLSIGYFNKQKELLEIHDMTPVTSEAQLKIPEYPSKQPVQYALEVPQGWFTKNNIKIRQKFHLKESHGKSGI